MSSVDYVCAIVSVPEGRRVVSPKQHSPSGRMGGSAEAGPPDVARIVSYRRRLSLIYCTRMIALLDEAIEGDFSTRTTQAVIVGGESCEEGTWGRYGR